LIAADYGADHLDMLVRRGYERIVPEKILKYILSNPAGADLINLPSLDSGGLCAQAAKAVSKRWHVEQGEVCPYIRLEPTWEEYSKNGLDKRMGRKLRRSMQRVVSDTSGTVRAWQVKNERERVMALESMFDLHLKKWAARGQESIFEDIRLRDFHHEMSQMLLKCGCLRMFVLSVGQAIVAVEYDIRCRDVNYSFQKSFSSVWSEYDPGYLLTQYAIQQSIEEGVSEFDLLRGNEPYKKYWATGQRYDLNFWLPVTGKGWLVWLVRQISHLFFRQQMA
jgi:CelD/BcsL family acetyltransferase involved in cellulose biosynthesis